MAVRTYNRNEVFVVGGQPTITYNPRPALGLDQRVRDYLDERGRILCVTGPTKSGKTVLVRQVIPQSVRVSGGSVKSVDDFWVELADGCEAFTQEGYDESVESTDESSDQITGGVKPYGVGVEGATRQAARESRSQRHSQSRTRDLRRAAAEELRKTGVTVVVDDFHHIPAAVQRQIVRGIKDLVFDRVPFVFIAVPHHAADVVRAEPEMQGRVEHLRVIPWTEEELGEIATKGFDALNIDMPPEMSQRMARESYGSPHLMQNFCLQICKANEIRATLAERSWMGGEANDHFFRTVAETGDVDATYQRLAQGPRPRTDRMQRRLKAGETTDIYGIVLRAIADTGPEQELKWFDIREAMRRIMSDNPPSQQEVTRVVERISKIARDLVLDEKGELAVGDPVIDFDSALWIVHVADPFFAFHLRWRVRAT